MPDASVSHPTVTTADLQARKTAAQRQYATQMVEMAYREERRMYRQTSQWLMTGLIGIAVALAAAWLGAVRQKPASAGWLMLAMLWLRLFLMIGAGFVAVCFPFAFMSSLIGWVVAMKERRRVVNSVWHLDARYAGSGWEKPEER